MREKKHSRFSIPPLAPLLLLFALMVVVVATSIKPLTPVAKPSESPQPTAAATPLPTAAPTPAVTPAPTEEAPTPTPVPSPEESAPKTDATAAGRPKPEKPKPTEAPTRDIKNLATETLGGILVVGDTGYEFYNFNQSVADSYIETVDKAATSLEGTASVYDIIVPTSMGVMLDPEFAENAGSSNQRKAIDFFHNSFNKVVKPIDIMDVLREKGDQYLYYRTDHHWTSLGAYYAYTAVAEAAGFKPLDLSQYTKKEYPDYLGSFYEETQNNVALGNNPDTVEAYIPPDKVVMDVTQEDGVVLSDWPMIADGTDYDTSMKYIIFLAGDNPFTEMTNENATSGKSCLLIKESFGNAFAPFLTSNYKKVYVVDYRYYKGKVQDLVKEKGIDDVFIMNNISATRSEYLVGALADVF
ncbi:MAG: DHHW family protein [Oscillospiraceae bacterium]